MWYPDTFNAEDIEKISFSIPGISCLGHYLITAHAFAELLKAHRQDYLFRQYEMLQIPFVSPALEERFSAQVSCT